MKIAIVHDWLVGGGAEKVILELHHLYPDAPIYTSYCSDEWRERLDGTVVTGWLQHWPFSRLRKYIPPLRIWWFSHLNLKDYDIVISSSGNGEAHGVRVRKGAKHIWYCHAPTHFYWRHYDHYLKNPGFGIFNPLARLGLRVLVGPLRRWDKRAAQRPDIVLANSTHTARDIKTYYGREATVLHPPVDTERFAPGTAEGRSGYVTMGRLNPYKRVDLIIEACNRLQLPLTVVGSGPEADNLKKLAGPTIMFHGRATDGELPAILAGAEGFIFAAFEDFGIAPVEAMATGTPLIAYRDGGALDYVIEHETGVFFDKQTTDSLVSALKKFKPDTYKPSVVSKRARDFSAEAFRQNFTKFMASVDSDA